MRTLLLFEVSRLLFIHLLYVGIVTVYCLIHTYQRREKMSCMTGMMIAMITAMMPSLSVGLMLGMKYPSELAVSSAAAVMIGMIAGFVSGKPVSLMAAMDGMAAGIMGGLMGAMLGVMLTPPSFMVWFVDLVFSLMMVMVFLLIREEEQLFEKWKNQQSENGDGWKNGSSPARNEATK